MSFPIEIRQLSLEPRTVEDLCVLIIETVTHGGSVGFMHPLSEEAARRFWEKSLSSAANGERVILGAIFEDRIIGTVTLLLDTPPNQPHRAEIAKMMTRVNYRGRGVARQLLDAAEEIARERARTVINLDTASEEGAAGLYESMGYISVGEIPDYALKPHGGLTGTIIYYKRIGK